MNRAGGAIYGSGPLELIQVRHEEMAAFMACAHAKFTGEVGVLPGDLGTGRDSPAQRPVRRQATSPRPSRVGLITAARAINEATQREEADT